jgi:membrane protein
VSAPTDEAPSPLPPGPTARTLGAISGSDLDPPDTDSPVVVWSVTRWDVAAWAWRWWERYRDGRGSLSAKGIAFYSFFGLLSGLALAFGIVARLPEYEPLLREILDEALPGLVGPDGVDPDQLQSVGATVGIVGALVLLYSAVSIVRALDDGVRLVYGVQYDPRPFVLKYLRLLGYFVVLAPLLAAAYVGSSAMAGVFRPLLNAAGVSGQLVNLVVFVAGLGAAVFLNSLVIVIIISRLGGVLPERWRWRAALIGGAALEVVKLGTTYFVAFTVANPRYLSFGAPVAMLLLFYTMSVVVLVAAAFVATANEPDPTTAARRRQVSRRDDA